METILPSMHEGPCLVLALKKLGVIAYACNPSTKGWREVAVGGLVSAEGSEVQCQG